MKSVNLIPTNKLRWVETNDFDTSSHAIWSNWGEITSFKLQQYYKVGGQNNGEWKDVEIEWEPK